jgi:putative tryptophan/tyrosine transport system substrate-binding protein
VKVIVAGGSPAIRAIQQATQTILIAMATTYEAVVQGFVASLAHLGGNTTGVSYLGAKLAVIQPYSRPTKAAG